MYICMTAHGWPQVASDHTTSQEEIMTSQKKSNFAWKENYELWLQGSYPFSQRLFHGPLWGQDHWKTLWCFHLHFIWLFNIMLSMKYNVIFLAWNLETERIYSVKIPFSWNICRGKHKHQCSVCVSLLSTKGLLLKNSESFINPEIYTCNILPSLV